MEFRPVFYEKIRSESGRELLLVNIIKFLQFQMEKFERKERQVLSKITTKPSNCSVDTKKGV